MCFVCINKTLNMYVYSDSFKLLLVSNSKVPIMDFLLIKIRF